MNSPQRICSRLVALLSLLAVAVALAPGCNTLRFGLQPPEKPEVDKDVTPTTPAKHSLRVSQYVFLSDFEVKRELPIFKELEDLREQLYKDLQLPPSNTLVQVYLFEDRDKYERFMHAKYPDLPRRRAFFVEQQRVSGGNDLLVFTYWGNKVQQDLRHELTHALLHSVLKAVPMWLDEGLAENYELPANYRGINDDHLKYVQNATFKPDMERLEQLSQVEQMAPPEYREAWAWVHMMLHGKPEGKTVLLAYLQQLKTNPNPGPMAPRLTEVYPTLAESLKDYIARLDTAAPAEPRVQRRD